MTSSAELGIATNLIEDEMGAHTVLRVALDEKAMRAFEGMAQSLKSESYVRLTPSKYISFLTCFYFQNYFEKDRELLISEFFDAKDFVAQELKKVKDPEGMEAALELTMRKVRKMQELKDKVGRSKRGSRRVAKFNAKSHKKEDGLE